MVTPRHIYSDAHSGSTEAWDIALANLREADARFAPIHAAFSAAERAYFALARQGTLTREALELAYEKAELDKAVAEERLHGEALNDAANAFYDTPSPDLAALITKVEYICSIGYGGEVEPLILKDLRQLQQRFGPCGPGH
jgi:hypothetical protein